MELTHHGSTKASLTLRDVLAIDFYDGVDTALASDFDDQQYFLECLFDGGETGIRVFDIRRLCPSARIDLSTYQSNPDPLASLVSWWKSENHTSEELEDLLRRLRSADFDLRLIGLSDRSLRSELRAVTATPEIDAQLLTADDRAVQFIDGILNEAESLRARSETTD